MKYLFILSLFAFVGCETNPTGGNKSFEFDLRWLALKDKADCKIEKSAHFDKGVLLFQPAVKNNHITISGIGSKVDWGQAKYLICEVYNPDSSANWVCFDFYRKSNEETTSTKETPVISPKVEVLPSVKTILVLPLSFLDGQSVSIDRIPGQSVIFNPGNKLDPKEIGLVYLSLSTPADASYQPRIEISALYLSNVRPEKISKKQ